MGMMTSAVGLYDQFRSAANRGGEIFGLLPIRLLLAWEYFEAGLMKFNGSNWFEHVQEDFPFPFNMVPVDVNWFLATWSELLGGIALAANVACLMIIHKHKEGGLHMQASWIFSANDVIANVGVILGGVLVRI